MPENTLQGEHRQLHLRRDADDREQADAAALRAGIPALTSSVITLAGVIAPLAMGAVIQYASSPLAGNEQSYVILGGLLLAGIGLLFIGPRPIGRGSRRTLSCFVWASAPLTGRSWPLPSPSDRP